MTRPDRCADNEIWCIDKKTGEKLWAVSAEPFTYVARNTDTDYIYLCSSHGDIYALYVRGDHLETKKPAVVPAEPEEPKTPEVERPAEPAAPPAEEEVETPPAAEPAVEPKVEPAVPKVEPAEPEPKPAEPTPKVSVWPPVEQEENEEEW